MKTIKMKPFRILFTPQTTDLNSYNFFSFMLTVLLIKFSPWVGILEFAF